MRFCYGPVSSWRYGRSLGVDVTALPKKCTYNCIYCQLGSTMKHVVSPEEIQREMPSLEKIVSEFKETLDTLDQQSIDVVTISGTGEPTLNLQLRQIASSIREKSGELPLILLTNASLLSREAVFKGVLGFDIVTAKYDAGDEDTFKKINRPAKGSFKLHDIHDAIKNLGKEIRGTLALEVMLLRGPHGITNVHGHPRRTLVDGILDVNPDLVQIYTPWRPPSVSTTKPVSIETLQKFGAELEDHLGSDRLWIYGIHDARGKAVVWKAHHALEEEVLTLLRRRPCRPIDITLSLGVLPAVATSTLEHLFKNGDVSKEHMGSDIFYKVVSM